jgi:glycosyltransferase involved in cell wall biosynthesis
MFTIVTASFNAAATLGNAIESVARQSFRDFEYLVLDGGSSDTTLEILEQRNAQIDRWISEPDAGIYDAWNKAVGLARGRWIAFLGADDEYLPDALANYAQFLVAEEAEGAAGLQYVSSRVNLTRGSRVLGTVGSAWSWPGFSSYMLVAHVGSLHHRSLFEQYGEFDTSYRICGDYELLLRPKGALRAGFLPLITARMGYGGVSTLRPRLALRETQRAKRTSGGRAAWRCALEYQTAHAKAITRNFVRRWQR